MAIMALGLCLRLFLINGGIDLDESVTEYVSSSQSIHDLVYRIEHYEFGPPLYFYMMMLWRKVTPDQPIYLALPSLFFSIALISLTYLLAKKLTDSNKIAIVSALFCALSPLAMFYSREARVYSLSSCLNVITAYFYIKWLKDKNKSSLVGLAISASLVAYTHYLGFFFLGLLVMGAFVYCVLEKKTSDFLKTIPIFFIPAILFLPWLNSMKEHMSVGTYWVERTPLANWWQVLASNIAALTPAPWILGAFFSIPVILVFIVLWLKKKPELPKSEIAFLLAIILPPVILVGYVTPFILGYCRYMMPFAPFAWIIFATLFSKSLKPKMLVALLVILGLFNSYEAYSLGSLNRSGLRQLAHDIRDNHFGDCLYLVIPDFDVYTLRYYLRTENSNWNKSTIIAFPDLNLQHPNAHQGYASTWSDKDNVSRLMTYLESSKEKTLLVIRDTAILESSQMPAKSRTEQVMAKLGEKYQKIGETIEYKGKGRTYLVERFNLSSNK